MSEIRLVPIRKPSSDEFGVSCPLCTEGWPHGMDAEEITRAYDQGITEEEVELVATVGQEVNLTDFAAARAKLRAAFE